MPKIKYLGERPFETDYAGAWKGHCKTRENAINAAMRHVVSDGYTNATITNLHTGEIVARIRISEDRRSASLKVIEPLKRIT